MSSDPFTRLVDAHYAPLYRLALGLAGNPADACDLVQQTFLIWARKGHALRFDAKARSWLCTTLYREYQCTRSRESRSTSLETLLPDAQELIAEAVDGLAQLDAASVLAALHSLDGIFREPLALFYLEELSYQEIAGILKLPLGTVMSRLSRGKAHLRAALAGGGRGPAPTGQACLFAVGVNRPA
jgi:RNA polymerase sigma-70 factor (ECF subfamily)